MRVGTTTGLSTLSSPGSVACAISNPGLVTGYARTRGDAPRAVICTGRALHDLSSLLLRAPAPARPACDPTNPCTRPTHREACHVPTHPPPSPRTAGADRSRHRNRAGGPRAGGQFMVAAGPATRRMRVVRVPTRAGGQRGRHGGRRRIPAERRQQLFRTGLYQRRRADLARAGHRRPGREPRRGARPGRPGRHGMGRRTLYRTGDPGQRPAARRDMERPGHRRHRRPRALDRHRPVRQRDHRMAGGRRHDPYRQPPGWRQLDAGADPGRQLRQRAGHGGELRRVGGPHLGHEGPGPRHLCRLRDHPGRLRARRSKSAFLPTPAGEPASR